MPDSSPRRDLLIAPLSEAFLLAAAALAGFAAHQPLIFASLGPTAYEIVETPHRRSAQPYSVVVGHLIAIAGGYLALWATGAWTTPPVSAHGVPLLRVASATLAAAFTVIVNLLLKAGQPAALSTTLLIALGLMQQPRDAGILLAGVLIVAILGEPIRLLRLRHQQQQNQQQHEA